MPIKMALVGCGHMGRIHLEKLFSFNDIKLAGIADVDTEQVNQLAQQHKVTAFNDYRKLLGNTDGVVIATPTETHYQIAKDFLEIDSTGTLVAAQGLHRGGAGGGGG